MRSPVFDASVVVKWYVPEVHSVEAKRWLAGRRAILAPDLLFSEVANALWKKQRRRELEPAEAESVMDQFLALPLTVHASGALAPAALDLAVGLDRSAYDTTYLALAILAETQFVTADRKFFCAISAGPLAARVRWVEDIPGPETQQGRRAVACEGVAGIQCRAAGVRASRRHNWSVAVPAAGLTDRLVLGTPCSRDGCSPIVPAGRPHSGRRRRLTAPPAAAAG